MRHGDYYDAPLGMSNAIKGKKTLSIFDLTMICKPKVCFFNSHKEKRCEINTNSSKGIQSEIDLHKLRNRTIIANWNQIGAWVKSQET
jgi:hypothetical protein